MLVLLIYGYKEDECGYFYLEMVNVIKVIEYKLDDRFEIGLFKVIFLKMIYLVFCYVMRIEVGDKVFVYIVDSVY